MDCKEAITIFENDTKRSVVQIECCSTGIANYVFIVSTATEKFVLRCSKDANAYKDASIGSTSCLYVKSRFPQSYHKENTKIIRI